MAEAVNPALDVTVSGPVARLVLVGDWTIGDGERIDREIESAIDAVSREGIRHAIIDFCDAGRVDTSGAFLIDRLGQRLGAKGLSMETANADPELIHLIDRLNSLKPGGEVVKKTGLTFADLLAEIGESVAGAWADLSDAMTVFGRIMAGIGGAVRAPRRIRFASVIHHLEHAGLRAVPIVALMSFLIGAIIAQQGAFQLRAFGAEIFTVDLVGILVLREIGVLLTAIMIAGRSGSAFTAEIGAMKMREEVDALKIIGLDPIEVLALPRVMALMIALPLLTFVSDMTAILGAMIVSMIYSGIEPAIFVERLRDAADLSTFVVGFIKAPFMALVIGLVACVEGFRVEGSSESLGRQTTASVVKSIFMVIVMDGVFAIYFATIDL